MQSDLPLYVHIEASSCWLHYGWTITLPDRLSLLSFYLLSNLYCPCPQFLASSAKDLSQCKIYSLFYCFLLVLYIFKSKQRKGYGRAFHSFSIQYKDYTECSFLCFLPLFSGTASLICITQVCTF